ncbi:hypothetical protein LTR10_024197 [Elasticomyces elasticus]|uniref:Xylanolytic transcriptional activator regulatory domain-containing protein n=1 Tax=Exophiala sideris TaxID=1016849 RepID=A0ABR0J953_9EURO|nr:hypothetical protein LTR10_024197 [Elasticomyces elasticus]KAK5027955.1 hypothetical protein LTS07_006831 [Exophiala sideris]KAK5059115.1 hypothetical protein LTR69_006404 [Exophiala sideris]KAK5182949.1 hypothetical protein LTR44_004659 [Eurotiomycetes sp. CCFEE 6388]
MSEENQSDGESNSLRTPAVRATAVGLESCQTARIVCRTTKRNAEKRQRVLVSGRYERELEDVTGRLSGLERTLQRLLDEPNTAGRSSRTSSPAVPTPSDNQLIERDVDFAGDSSFVAHSKDVTQAFEKTLNTSPISSSIRDVSAAVATLRNFLNENSGTVAEGSMPVNKPLREAVHYPELANLTLPPMPAVLRLLRHCKVHRHRFFFETPTIDVQYLTELCQKIYFPTDEYTIATFITVHVSLNYLFRQLPKAVAQELGFTTTELRALAATCSKNAETAMLSLRMYMEANYENIEALLFASMMALELSRPSLSWTLISSAARMVQDAGYHRLPSYTTAPECTKKRVVFWIVYALDHSMALNLGRSPNLHDCDITVDRPRVPEELENSYGQVYMSWMDFAELQGQIYEQLYCPRAQRQTTEVRANLARALAFKVTDMKTRFNIDPGSIPSPEFGEESMLSMQIVFESTLTLVYRTIPPEPLPSGRQHHPLKFCNEAIESARQALTMHKYAWNALKDRETDEWHSFLQWTVLWCPFIPYTVLFGNVIADRNSDDLGLLGNVVSFMEAVANMGPGIGKLYRACRIFYQIASIYLSQPGSDVAASVSQGLGSSSYASTRHPLQHGSFAPLENGMHLGDTMIPDLPLFPQDWDVMLDGWDLGTDSGPGAMSTFLEQYLPSDEGVRNDVPTDGQEPFA